jgi:hypothetical protein
MLQLACDAAVAVGICMQEKQIVHRWMHVRPCRTCRTLACDAAVHVEHVVDGGLEVGGGVVAL